MNWKNIGPFCAFFLENALFCGYAVLAAVSSFAVHRLLKIEENGQKQNSQPVYFQRTLLNKSQQKISLMLLFLALAGIVLYQPASFTVNSLLVSVVDCNIFTVGSELWENFIVFLILPLASFNFIISIGTSVWLLKLARRLNEENILEKRIFRRFFFVDLLVFWGISLLTAALLWLLQKYA